MRHTLPLLTIFLLTTSIVCGQQPKAVGSTKDHQEIVDSLRRLIDQTWIIPNPELSTTRSSFFNKDNESKYFVGIVELGRGRDPFAWDDNLALLQYLLSRDGDVNIKNGIAADEYNKGTKITWNKSINGLICFNDTAYKATVDHWSLSTVTECRETIIFPLLAFKKVNEIKYPLETVWKIQGLAIFPYNAGIHVKRTDAVMTAKSGKTIKGIGYDLDKDGIFDVFSYEETIDEVTEYTRLYINVNGEWKCTWIYLFQECI